MYLFILLYGLIYKGVNGQVSTYQPTDLTVQCPEGWYQYGEKCFITGGGNFRKYVHWSVARDRCAEIGGEMGSIHSKDELEFLISYLMSNAQTSLWIGLNDLETDGKHVWTDGSPFDYKNWDANEPTLKYDVRKEGCAEMRFNGHDPNRMGKWNDLICDHTLSYLCEMPINKDLSNPNPKYCPEVEGGGFNLITSCFHYVNTPMTWSAAEEFCITRYDGHLVAIQDQVIHRFLNHIMKEMGKFSPIWIGMKADGGKGPQRWSSGQYVTYQTWAKPFSRTSGACVARVRNGEWDSRDCERKYEFICEVNSRKIPVLQPSIEGSYCPTDPDVWTDLGGDYCYFFGHASHLNWHGANFECLRKGGTLASVHSDAEMFSIEQFIRYNSMVYFIGFFRKHDLSFVWMDGSPVDYTRWDVGSPGDKNELCSEFRQDTVVWNDIGCGEKRAFICSVKKIPPNITVSEENVVCSGELLIIQ